jgi:LPXTG-motif cell wall-anchored protein
MRKVVNGDILNARGDVFPATGDMFQANGDFFNTDGLTPEQQASVDRYFQTQAELEKDVEEYSAEYDKKESGGSVLNTIDRILGFADKGADIYSKFKTGTTVEEEGISYDVQAGMPETKKDNTMWYIAGGVVVLLIVVGIVVSRRKK